MILSLYSSVSYYSFQSLEVRTVTMDTQCLLLCSGAALYEIHIHRALWQEPLESMPQVGRSFLYQLRMVPEGHRHSIYNVSMCPLLLDRVPRHVL
jgi:hypothetical protein